MHITRKEYLLEQKEKGRRLMGVFPALYPREILWALDIVPAEIWDPPLEIRRAGAHLQPYICSVVRLGLELILQGKCDFLDGFLFPHTCDSIQNLASVIYDFIGARKPCYFFYHPKIPHGHTARDYYLKNLKALAAELKRQFGPLKMDSLREKVDMGRRISELLGELYDLRAARRLDASNEAFYRTIRKGEYLFPDDYIAELEGFLTQTRSEESRNGATIILSGILPNPPQILTLLDDLDVQVGHDDLLNGSRRLLISNEKPGDPFEYMAECYFHMPPCPTRGSSISDRMRHLLSLINATGAKGVIFNVVKFCEPEWFDVPNLQEELKKRGVPSLVLDTELNQGLSGQMKTRLEAFIEIVRVHRESITTKH